MDTMGSEEAIGIEVPKLTFEEQKRVLAFVHSLEASRECGVAGRELLRFAGQIETNDLERMRTAIEEDCERLNANEW